jgi:seryl-tRNA synthetase
MTDMEAHIVIAEHLRDELRGIRETLADQQLLGEYYTEDDPRWQRVLIVRERLKSAHTLARQLRKKLSKELGECEKALKITWVDEEARARDLPMLEDKIKEYYLEDYATDEDVKESLRAALGTFQQMEVEEVVRGDFKTLQDQFGSESGFGEYFRGEVVLRWRG